MTREMASRQLACTEGFHQGLATRATTTKAVLVSGQGNAPFTVLVAAIAAGSR